MPKVSKRQMPPQARHQKSSYGASFSSWTKSSGKLTVLNSHWRTRLLWNAPQRLTSGMSHWPSPISDALQHRWLWMFKQLLRASLSVRVSNTDDAPPRKVRIKSHRGRNRTGIARTLRAMSGHLRHSSAPEVVIRLTTGSGHQDQIIAIPTLHCSSGAE